MANNFAINQLKKYGWSQGQGLGKNSEGRKKPIVVSKKDDTRGLGDNSTDWSFEWWNHVYNNTLNNIKISKTADGDVKVSKIVSESIIPRNQMGIISTSESLYPLESTNNSEPSDSGGTEADGLLKKVVGVRKRFLYNGFVKSSTGPLYLNSANKKPQEPDANNNCSSPSTTVLPVDTSKAGDVSRNDGQSIKKSNGKRFYERPDDFSEVDSRSSNEIKQKGKRKKRKKKNKETNEI